MCGICGVAHTDRARPVDEAMLARMNETIRHRGPDDDGMFLAGQVGLAMRRLSIIDLQTGKQPICNEDGSKVIVFNGEIYNYPDLRRDLIGQGHTLATHSDTETIVHLYEERGPDCVEALNGMFAFALWDATDETLLLALDRTGIKPLYYLHTPEHLIFGSELKAILAADGVERRIDFDALDEYLTFEHVPAPHTIFEGIRKLPPGHVLIWREGQITVRPYWDLCLERSENDVFASSMQSEAAKLRDVFREAVRAEMIADVPVGVLLSGGIDSSGVAAMMAELVGGPNVQSFSITFDDPSFDEGQYARLVAAHLNTQHRELTLTPAMLLDMVPRLADVLDEPLADSSLVPTTLLSRFVREHVKVALGGDGGDEMFAGYTTLVAHKLLGPYRAFAPGFLRRNLVPAAVGLLPTSFNNISLDFKFKRFVAGAELPLGMRHQTWLGSFTTDEKASIWPFAYRREEAETYRIVDHHLGMCRAQDVLNRALYLDFKMYMAGDILPKVDRASMSASLEVRVPFLNKLLLDYVETLPHSYKLRGLTTKAILRRSLDGLLPKPILKRGKKGFNIPVAKWLAGPLRGWATDLLSVSRLERQGIFDPAGVNILLRDHFNGRHDHRKLLWTLLTFQMWVDRWMGS